MDNLTKNRVIISYVIELVPFNILSMKDMSTFQSEFRSA